jgi:hypothetical protein
MVSATMEGLRAEVTSGACPLRIEGTIGGRRPRPSASYPGRVGVAG